MKIPKEGEFTVIRSSYFMQLQVLEKNLKERASNVEGTFDSLYFHILMNIAICMYY